MLSLSIKPPALARSPTSTRLNSRSKELSIVFRRAQPKHRETQLPDDSDFVQEVITFFTAEGVVQVPGRRIASHRPQSSLRRPLPTWEEQGLCIGATFWINAYGLDPTRRFGLSGFCRCTDLLSEVVGDTVLRRGGEIVVLERLPIHSGLSQKLKMTVTIPLLWGIPPEHEVLSNAIRSGGGVVEKITREWLFASNS